MTQPHEAALPSVNPKSHLMTYASIHKLLSIQIHSPYLTADKRGLVLVLNMNAHRQEHRLSVPHDYAPTWYQFHGSFIITKKVIN